MSHLLQKWHDLASDDLQVVGEKEKVGRIWGFLAGSLVWEDGVLLTEKRTGLSCRFR